MAGRGGAEQNGTAMAGAERNAAETERKGQKSAEQDERPVCERERARQRGGPGAAELGRGGGGARGREGGRPVPYLRGVWAEAHARRDGVGEGRTPRAVWKARLSIGREEA